MTLQEIIYLRKNLAEEQMKYWNEKGEKEEYGVAKGMTLAFEQILKLIITEDYKNW
jgi:hypothetical protein